MKNGKNDLSFKDIFVYLGIAAGIVAVITIIIVVAAKSNNQDGTSPDNHAKAKKNSADKKNKKSDDDDSGAAPSKKDKDDDNPKTDNKDDGKGGKKDDGKNDGKGDGKGTTGKGDGKGTGKGDGKGDGKGTGKGDGKNPGKDGTEPEDKITYTGKPIFDKDGKILYNDEYVTEDKLATLLKMEGKKLELIEYTGDNELYKEYKGKKNTIENWEKIGLIYVNISGTAAFFTKTELRKYKFGCIKSTGEWKKIDDILKSGLVESPKDGFYYTPEEMKKNGFGLFQDKWESEEELEKKGCIRLKDGSWDTEANLTSKGFHKIGVDWLSPEEQKKDGYLKFKNEVKKKDEWLTDKRVAVHGDEIMTIDEAKKQNLKQNPETNEWMTEEELNKASGKKEYTDPITGKKRWVTEEELAKIEEEKKKKEEEKKKKEEEKKAREKAEADEKKARELYDSAMKKANPRTNAERNEAINLLNQLQRQYPETKFYKSVEKNVADTIRKLQMLRLTL